MSSCWRRVGIALFSLTMTSSIVDEKSIIQIQLGSIITSNAEIITSTQGFTVGTAEGVGDGFVDGSAVGATVGTTVGALVLSLLHLWSTNLHHAIRVHRLSFLPRHQALRQNPFFFRVALTHSHCFLQEDFPRSSQAFPPALAAINNRAIAAFQMIAFCTFMVSC
jgi:hypothetical protein